MVKRGPLAQWVFLSIMLVVLGLAWGAVVSSAWSASNVKFHTTTRIRQTCKQWVLHAKNPQEGEIDDATKNSQAGEKKLVAFDITNSPQYNRFAAFLAREIGLTDPAKVKKIAERSPTTIAFTEAALKERFDLFRDLFSYSNDDLQKVVYRGAHAFNRTSKTLRNKINQLSHILLIDNDLEAVGVILLKQPTLLTNDMTKNLAPKIEYLRERVFQDDNDAMIIALTNNPAVLSISLDKRIMPRSKELLAAGINPSHYFHMSYKTTDAQFQTWFEKKTSTCLPDDWSLREKSTLSLQERYQQRIELFCTKLEMTTEEATHVIEKWPNIKRLNLGNLSAKIDGIVGIYFGSKHYASQAIQTLPQLVTYSTQMNLQPKVEYLREYAFSRDTAALMDTITKCPAIICSYSLENRIKPRLDAVLDAGLTLKGLSIAGVIKKRDDQFAVWLENRKKELLEEKLW